MSEHLKPVLIGLLIAVVLFGWSLIVVDIFRYVCA